MNSSSDDHKQFPLNRCNIDGEVHVRDHSSDKRGAKSTHYRGPSRSAARSVRRRQTEPRAGNSTESIGWTNDRSLVSTFLVFLLF